jgi:hypothetical protein
MKMNFSAETARKQPMRTAPSKYLTSRLRPNVERSDGIALSEAFYPARCLPVMWQDVETEEWVVLTKGTIVSLLTKEIGASGMVNVSSSGSIPVFDDATTAAADVVTANIDSSYWGYPEAIAGLLTPANGGAISEIPYSTNDVTAGTFCPGAHVMTTARLNDPIQNFYSVAANMPIGIVYQDVYQDIRGKSLNYETFSIWGVLCDKYIEVPFVDYYKASNFVSGFVDSYEDKINNMSTTTCAGYINVWKKYPFFYFSSNAGPIGAYPGQLIKSDLYGKFMPQGTAVTTAATAQTIGKLVLTDSRFPKDMLEAVDTYYDSRMPGTQTAGAPGFLFEFIRDAYYGANGTYPDASTVMSRIQSGDYGVARIQLNI